MTAINQELPKNEAPSFLGYSKSISQPDANKGIGIALEGIGKAFESITSYLDTSNKRTIADEVDTFQNQNTDTQVSVLETLAGVDKDKRVTSENQADPNYVPKTLIPGARGGGEDVPQEVAQDTEAGVGAVDSLTSAHGSRKIPFTYYLGRADMFRKDLRSRYPGYKDFIDSKMGNTGNAYMNALASEIQSQMGSKNAEVSKVRGLLTKMSEEGIDTAPSMYHQYMGGNKTYTDVLHYVAAEQGHKREVEILKANHEKKGFIDAAEEDDALQTIGAIADSKVAKSQIQLADGTLLNMDQVQKFLKDYADPSSGIIKDDAKMSMITQAFKAQAQGVYADIVRSVSTPLAGSNKTLAGKVKDPDKIKKRIEFAMSPMKTQVDLLEVGDFALANSLGQANKAIRENSTNKLFTSEDINTRAFNQMIAGAKGSGGDQLVAMIMPRIWGSDIEPKFDVLRSHFTGNILTQTGKTRTINQALDAFKQANFGVPKPNGDAADAATTKREAAVVQDVTKLPNLMTKGELSDQILTNIINGSYSGDNVNILMKFDNEHKDAQGNVIPGKNAIYQEFTTNDKADVAYKQGQRDPKLWESYVNWTLNSFQHLNTANVNQLAELVNSSDKRVTVVYHAPENRFSIDWSGSSLAAGANKKRQADLKELELRINRSIAPIAYIASKQGSDPNAMILHSMAASTGKITEDSVIGKMFKAIISSGKPKEDSSKAGTTNK